MRHTLLAPHIQTRCASLRRSLLALALGFCSLPALAASLDDQFNLMEKGAKGALDTRLFSHDGVDIKAWVDGAPVIIVVPLLNEQGKREGESRYYFKGGKLFGVKEPAARFGFDEQGNLTQWQDEQGQPAEFISKVSMQQRQEWLTRRAAELNQLFAPASAEAQVANGTVKLKGGELTQWLCNGKLLALAEGDKVQVDPQKIAVSEQGMEGEVALHRTPGWQAIGLHCEVRGNRVTRLTWQPEPGADLPQ